MCPVVKIVVSLDVKSVVVRCGFSCFQEIASDCAGLPA